MSNLTIHNQMASKLAERLGVENSDQLIDVLKSTAFKGKNIPSDAQMTALLIVSTEYQLNPWTKEIYAFPDKNGGIVPVVGIDGWLRIINANEQYDGMEINLSQDGEEATCAIYRKDRSKPTIITEYLSECRRPTDPWRDSPRRMLRHKAIIQCARVAFGFGGIHDQDEAQSIIDMGSIDGETGEVRPAAKMPGSKKEKARQQDADKTIDVTATEVPEKTKQTKPADDGAQHEDTGEVASIGEKKHIEAKLKQAGIALDVAMKACGISSFESLTRDGFVAMRDYIRTQTA